MQALNPKIIQFIEDQYLLYNFCCINVTPIFYNNNIHSKFIEK